MIIIKYEKFISYTLVLSLLLSLLANGDEVMAADWAVIALDKCLPSRGQVQAGSGGMFTSTAQATVKCTLDEIPTSIVIKDVFVRLRRASVAPSKQVVCWMSTGQVYGRRTQDIAMGVARDTTLNQSVTIPVFSQKRNSAATVSCRLHHGDRFYGVHYQYSSTSANTKARLNAESTTLEPTP